MAETVHQSAAVDAMNALHRAKFDAITDIALHGYRALGKGYGDGEGNGGGFIFETWVDFGELKGKTVITGYHIKYGSLPFEEKLYPHRYKTAKAWLKKLNELTHKTGTVWRQSPNNSLSVPEQVDTEAYEAAQRAEAVEEEKEEQGMIDWVTGPSGFLQSVGGRYTLRPVGHGAYAVDVLGQYRTHASDLSFAKAWCEQEIVKAEDSPVYGALEGIFEWASGAEGVVVVQSHEVERFIRNLDDTFIVRLTRYKNGSWRTVFGLDIIANGAVLERRVVEDEAEATRVIEGRLGKRVAAALAWRGAA